MSTTQTPALAAPPMEQQVVAGRQPKKRRNSWVLVGVLIAVLGGLVAAWLFASTTRTSLVLAASGDLRPGWPIEETDLVVVEVGQGAGVLSIDADDQAVIIGEVPKFPIASGTLLAESMFVPADQLVPSGSTIMSTLLEPGSFPANIAPGDQVVMIDVAQETGAVLTTGQVMGVESVDTVGAQSRTLVTLMFDSASQVAVAGAGHRSELVLGMVDE